MTLSAGLLLTSTLLCALVTGFVFTYAVNVMPGLAKLADNEFIRARMNSLSASFARPGMTLTA